MGTLTIPRATAGLNRGIHCVRVILGLLGIMQFYKLTAGILWLTASNNVGTARVPDRHAGWGLSFRAPLIRPPATASQEISLDTNTIYQLSFWAIYKPSQESRCGNDENCAFVAQMRAHGDWNVNVSTTWSNFTYHSRGNGPNDVLSFVGYDDNGGTFVIDEVCLVACT